MRAVTFSEVDLKFIAYERYHFPDPQVQRKMEVLWLLHHGETIHLGDIELSVISLRGHTPGSVALHYRDPAGHSHLFTGDSLFPGGPGNTQGDPERFGQLITDLEDRIFAELPDGTWVYPGHGADTTIGTERPHVPEWRARGW